MTDGIFSRFIKGAFGEVANSSENPIVASVLRWTATLQGNLILKWNGVAMSRMRCSLHPKDASGRFVQCSEPALGACMVCHNAVCIQHSQINMQAEIVCLKCMVQAVTWLKANQPAAEPRAQPGASRPEEDLVAQRKAALKTLGLKDPATWDEIRQQHRALVAKWHPDKLAANASEKKREQHLVKMKELSQAFEWLKRHETKAA